MEVDAYLERIGIAPGPRPTLLELHERHQLTVPFENLDIHRGVPIVLDEAALLDKIVTRRRGGFCYELNGAFAWLLRGLGYPVTLLAAEVKKKDGGWGIPFDHMTLRVDLERAWLVDVGFGESFLYPLPLDGEEIRQVGLRYCVRAEGEWRIVERDGRPRYRFTLQPRDLAEFEPACRHHQTSPESSFTGGRIYSIATPSGRDALTETKRIVIRKGERTETPIDDFDAALRSFNRGR